MWKFVGGAGIVNFLSVELCLYVNIILSPPPAVAMAAGLRRSVSPRKAHLLDEVIGCGDMVLLEPLTQENVLDNLKKRFASGDIYVRY